MAEKDITEKTLEEYNDVFADIINVLLFHGKTLVEEDELTDLTPISQYKIDQKIHAQERDIAKYWTKTGVRFAIYGIENQTDIDCDMPLRIVSYDGAAYRTQLNEKNKDETDHIKRYPVVTLVLYFGKKPWNRPRSLYDRLIIPDELKPYVSDYKINVFEICRLTPEQVSLFKSDFRIVADYFVQTYRNDRYIPSTDTIKHVREVLDLLGVVSGDPNLENRFNQLNLSRKEGIRNMESVWSRTMNERYNEGISIGETRGFTKGRNEGISIGEARGISIGRNEGISIGEARAAARYQAQIAELQAKLAALNAL